MSDKASARRAFERFEDRPSQVYAVCPTSSQVRFRSKAFGTRFVRGSLPIADGSVTLDRGIMTASGALAASEIDTRLAPRDWHLRSNHYLAAKNYPQIEVRLHPCAIESEAAEFSLSLRGVTARFSLAIGYQFLEDGNLSLTANGWFDRSAYPMLPPWGGVSRMVHVDVEIVARKTT